MKYTKEKQQLEDSIKEAIDKFEKDTLLKLSDLNISIDNQYACSGTQKYLIRQSIDVEAVIKI